MTRSPFFVAAVIAAVVATAAGGVTVAAGAQIAPVKNTLWDGLYTDDQASRGNDVFSATCANCHTLDSQGNRPLSGKKFWDSYTQKTVGDLFTFMQKNMPNGNGGSLSEKTYADLVALVLKANGRRHSNHPEGRPRRIAWGRARPRRRLLGEERRRLRLDQRNTTPAH
jgi:mono/diheme cytochrome c family protein